MLSLQKSDFYPYKFTFSNLHLLLWFHPCLACQVFLEVPEKQVTVHALIGYFEAT